MTIWKFIFGRVEVQDELIIVQATENYKDIFQKKYKDIVNEKINKDAEKILKKVWSKGDRKKESISFSIKSELINLFEAIARAEGVNVSSSAYSDSDLSDDEKNKFDIKIDEKVELKMKNDGKIIENSVSGILNVANNGDKNRIWDIDLKLSGNENTNLKTTTFHILDLDPKEDWFEDYEINIKDIEIPLKIEEDIDVSPDQEEKSLTFVLDQEHEPLFKITMTNTSSTSINNIELRKTIPEVYSNLNLIEKGSGDVQQEDGYLIWSIDELGSDQSTTLEFTMKVTPKEKDPISSGQIEVKYTLLEETISGIEVEHVDAYSNNIYYVERDEREEEPDIWDCKFIFKNRSEFPLKLLDVDLKSGDYNTEEKVIDLGPQLDPDVIVNPGEEWVSEPWEVESEDLPTFGKNVLFTVVGDVINQLSASILIEAIQLPVLTLTGTKEFSNTEIQSYKESEIEVLTTVETSGIAPIDKFHIEDTLPQHFELVETENVKLSINDKEIDKNTMTFSFDPSNDVNTKRKMVIDVGNVLDQVGVLEDNSTIKLEYPLKAVKPVMGEEYSAPILFQAITEEGSIIELYIEVPEEEIQIIHERRRVTDGRVIQQGSVKGQYDIVIIHKNRGDAAEIDKVFEEVIPENFNLVSANPEPEQSGNKLTWTFEKIEPNEEIEIEFTIEGTGDYRARDAQISFKG
ncbi:MAG: hypothetical protein ACTSVY_15975 [Candidatus Helarchaeota archaeon]